MLRYTLATVLLLMTLLSQAAAIVYTTTTAVNTEPLDWSDGDSWVGGTVPDLTAWQGVNVNLDHDITYTGNMSVSLITLNIADDVLFTVDGNYTGNPGNPHASYNLTSSAVFKILDDLILVSDSRLQTSLGTIIVEGDFINVGNSVFTVTNSLIVKGTIDMSSMSSTINGGGDIIWGVLNIPSWPGGPTLGSCVYADFDLTDSGIDLSSCAVFLPVDFVSFTTNCTNEGVVLNWSTSSEKDNDFFEVQQVEGSFEFFTIGSVDGNGTTSSTSNYTFRGQGTSNNSVYYRLKQIDYNGDYAYSKVVVSTCEVDGNEFKIYPTVSEGSYTVSFNRNITFVNLQVVNELGVTVQTIVYTNNTGVTDLELDLSALKSSIYYVKAKLDNGLEVRKIIKL